jgi:succinoglycan biosynthesis protein ExoM
MKKQKVIIGIITYQRLKSLKILLSALQKQIISESFEVIILVVDNDGCGEVSNLVHQFSSAKIRVHMVVEPRKGISYARNKVVDFFLADEDASFLIFIDDDEWPMRDNWIIELLTAQRESGGKYSYKLRRDNTRK